MWRHCGTRSDFRKHRWLINTLQMPFETVRCSSFCVLGEGSASLCLGSYPRGRLEGESSVLGTSCCRCLTANSGGQNTAEVEIGIQCLTCIVVGPV